MDEILHLLIECQLCLDETADIHKYASETDVKKQMQVCKRLSKKIYAKACEIQEQDK